MATFRTIDDFDVRGKRVLVRADLNLPMKDGKVADKTRLERLVPTLEELADKGARVIVLSHFGRPKGKPAPEFSLAPIAPALGAALHGRSLRFVPDCVGPEARAAAAALKNGELMLLENVRFDAAEEKNDPAFAKQLASLGELYVDDAFACAHRANASIDAIARFLPAAAGRLMEAELKALESALETPTRPLAAVIGGAKVSTKIELLGNLIDKVDILIVGGAMANNFLAAQGISIGKSLVEADMIGVARDILAKAERRRVEFLLPTDAIVAPRLEPAVPYRAVPIGQVPADEMILDIGPATADALAHRLLDAKTLVWNGPLGAFETKPFDAGTVRVARAAADLARAGKLVSVAGGGDTVAALAHAGVIDFFNYVSTAGGAFLEWLEGKELPGVAALKASAARRAETA
ncbi:MAG TPA: phosphoglycerate kinase [Alphaproteobacteria bacterium]|nr:phosphoglycerate kinase [Alphaproteobacteria bacterium]